MTLASELISRLCHIELGKKLKLQKTNFIFRPQPTFRKRPLNHFNPKMEKLVVLYIRFLR